MTRDAIKTNELQNLKKGIYLAKDRDNNTITIIRNLKGNGWTVKRQTSGSLKNTSLECTTYLENGSQIETYYEKKVQPCPICGGFSCYKESKENNYVICMECGYMIQGDDIQDIITIWNELNLPIDKRIAKLSEYDAKIALLNMINYISDMSDSKIPDNFQNRKKNAILEKFLKREE